MEAFFGAGAETAAGAGVGAGASAAFAAASVAVVSFVCRFCILRVRESTLLVSFFFSLIILSSAN